MYKRQDVENAEENKYLIVLANRLTELRKEKGWSLAYLAEETKISRSKLNFVEINKPRKKTTN